MSCVDHKGNIYKDVAEMCKAYNISTSTYYRKLNAGYSKADILNKVPIPVMDHKGNEFRNIEEMCDYYGITTRTFYHLRKEGKTVSEIFNNAEAKSITDKYGNKFKNITQFCNFYGIRLSQYYYHINKGRTVDEIVDIIENYRHSPNGHKTHRYRSSKTINFENVVYESVGSLCKTYGIKPNTFYRRKERGFTLEECVYGKANKYGRPKFMGEIEFEGKKYKNFKSLCKDYNANYENCRMRHYRGWTLKECIYGKGVNDA